MGVGVVFATRTLERKGCAGGAHAAAVGIHCHFGHDGGPFGKRVDLVLAERLPRLSSVATMCQDVDLWDRQLTWGVV
jgi:hypothetical protein